MNTKNGCLIAIGVFAIAVLSLFVWVKSNYNDMVQQQELVNKSWADVESQYQRRADLIPNLVNTVKGYATHEQTTLEKVMQARANATSVKIDANNLDETQLKKFQEAQGQLGAALGRLIAVSENYPNLKANENFLELQAQLEGTENRIQKARTDFNGVANGYNTFIRQFPRNILAGLFNFQPKPYFQAEAGSDKAPEVKF